MDQETKKAIIRKRSLLEEEPGEEPEAHICDVCGYPLQSYHCELNCRRCGYRRDCSDP